MRLGRFLFAHIVLLGIISQTLKGQESAYHFPINPGRQNYLSGTMGELRRSHFHGGIDIKTGGVEGLPVYAAASGYISRIKVSGTGYGKVLYLAHPDRGTTTVYGHLQKFEDEVAAYVRKNQYYMESFEIELFPSKDAFKVEKGDIIGYSGNSGSSGGPHLHFEIRDAYQRPVNPLKFNFKEVKDQIAPTIQKVAIKTLDINARIKGQFGRFEYTPYRSGNVYRISNPIDVHGPIGIQVMAYDRLNGASNRNGVPHLSLKVDGVPVLMITIDKVPFNKNRNILAYRDNETKQRKNQDFQKLYIDDGNELDIYELSSDAGRINIQDTLLHDVAIELIDSYGNTSRLEFQIQGRQYDRDASHQVSQFKPYQFRIMDNTLILMSQASATEKRVASVYANRMRYALKPSYSINNYDVLLWDLRKGLPDSICYDETTILPKLEMAIPSNAAFRYYKDEMDLVFRSKTLFDTLYLRTDYLNEMEDGREYFEISEEVFPVRQSMVVTLKPRLTYRQRDKTSVYYTDDFNHFSYYGGTWNGKGIEFRTRDFGKYTLLSDTIPPTIRVIEQNKDRFRCYIKDDLSGIGEYRLTINGKWVLLNYDPKRNYCWTEKMDESILFEGELELKVTDNVNNEKIYSTKIY